MSTIHLIDYENVRSAGLAGLGPLGEGDLAVLFFSGARPKLDPAVNNRLLGRGAELRMQHVSTGTKNALDFQLASELGYLVRERGTSCQYRIVSNDKGFDCVVGYWRARGVSVKRAGACASAGKKAAAGKKAKAAAETAAGLTEKDVPAEVEKILATTRGKTAVNVALNRLYRDGKHAGRVYKIIKPRIKD